MNIFLVVASVGNALAALLHVGCIIFGASWYRFFGAGEQMALWAEQGSLRPTLITSLIVIALSVFTMYTLSGAQIIRRLPLLKIVLAGISALFLIRGVVGVYLMTYETEQGMTFWFWSSLICLCLGLVHFMGTIQVWNKH